jgi:peptide deformylase
MARLPILKHPDPRLRQLANPVTAFDDDLATLVEDMLETMYSADAIGLSAPQVDDHRRVLVIDPTVSRDEPQIFINPEIQSRAKFALVEEGCLSVPDMVGNVVRATEVAVTAYDRHGASFQHPLSGMAAVSLQHEIDHLDGTLFIDRLSMVEKLRMRVFAPALYRRARDLQRAEVERR